ncbi:hypothetical protein [Exiguobacterium flavidum]|uniref:hypothetical protein n=1 Tax=Exiguobacterium flavidum TaxID=2184695 RepID=UPI001300653E|nr:hypothetical protein [Exiguobacterium flavidum]
MTFTLIERQQKSISYGWCWNAAATGVAPLANRKMERLAKGEAVLERTGTQKEEARR